jgi:putative transcriptional regulator
MESLEGKFLIAMPGMGDHRFEKTVIFLCAHNAEGAMGFVVNRRLEQPTMAGFLTQLSIVNADEAKGLPPQLAREPMRSGGPVEPGRGFVLHSPDFRAASTLQVTGEVCLTATLEILRAIATGKGPRKSLLVLGYSGWAGGQLESEIAANGWLTSQSDAGVIFETPDEGKYRRALGLLGVDPRLLSAESGRA